MGEEGSAPHLLSLFSVPLALVDDALPASADAAAAAWILAERERDPGVQRSNAGGWHSRPDLPARGVPAVDAVVRALVDQVRRVHEQACPPPRDLRVRYVVQAWATVMGAGDHVLLHDHADAHWSVVHYVDAGDVRDEASGRIGWVNPMGAVRAMPGGTLVPTSFTLTPRTGLTVVFPGWLRHAVEPYRGARPRIAVAANVEVLAR
jgi:uncharacterized protein (TIGR02466 family)